MSSAAKVLLAVAGVGVVIGGVILISSTAKAKPSTAPSPSPFQFGNADTVQGRSGWVWAVARVLNPGPVAAGATVQAVFVAQPPPGVPVAAGGLVLMYAQQGSDESSRTLVSAQATGPVLDAARADFGV